MPRKSFGVVSAADIHGIRVAFIIIIFWIGVWNLTEELVSWIETNYMIERRKQYMGLVLAALLFIIIDPHTFEKL
jgi:hypothetical protein